MPESTRSWHARCRPPVKAERSATIAKPFEDAGSRVDPRTRPASRVVLIEVGLEDLGAMADSTAEFRSSRRCPPPCERGLRSEAEAVSPIRLESPGESISGHMPDEVVVVQELNRGPRTRSVVFSTVVRKTCSVRAQWWAAVQPVK